MDREETPGNSDLKLKASRGFESKLREESWTIGFG
jgi:hypothetical protein